MQLAQIFSHQPKMKKHARTLSWDLKSRHGGIGVASSIWQELIMKINELDFFRRAAVCICGSLDIDQAMMQCMRQLQSVMPADRIFLEQYDPELASMRTIAAATPTRGSTVDLLTPLPDKARAVLSQTFDKAQTEVYIEHNPAHRSVSREMLNFHGLKAKSLMVMPLGKSGQLISAAVFHHQEKQRAEAGRHPLHSAGFS